MTPAGRSPRHRINWTDFLAPRACELLGHPPSSRPQKRPLDDRRSSSYASVIVCRSEVLASLRRRAVSSPVVVAGPYIQLRVSVAVASRLYKVLDASLCMSPNIQTVHRRAGSDMPLTGAARRTRGCKPARTSLAMQSTGRFRRCGALRAHLAAVLRPVASRRSRRRDRRLHTQQPGPHSRPAMLSSPPHKRLIRLCLAVSCGALRGAICVFSARPAPAQGARPPASVVVFRYMSGRVRVLPSPPAPTPPPYRAVADPPVFAVLAAGRLRGLPLHRQKASTNLAGRSASQISSASTELVPTLCAVLFLVQPRNKFRDEQPSPQGGAWFL